MREINRVLPGIKVTGSHPRVNSAFGEPINSTTVAGQPPSAQYHPYLSTHSIPFISQTNLNSQVERRQALRRGHVNIRAALHEGRHHTVEALLRGTLQRGHLLRGLMVWVVAALEEKIDEVDVAIEGGEGGGAQPRLTVAFELVRPAGDELLYDLKVATGGGLEERTRTFSAVRVRVCADGKEETDAGDVTSIGGVLQARDPADGRAVVKVETDPVRLLQRPQVALVRR